MMPHCGGVGQWPLPSVAHGQKLLLRLDLFWDLLRPESAGLTLIWLPSMRFPFKDLIAWSASELLGISMKPNPLGLPENLSFTILTLSTSPKSANNDFKLSSVVLNDKFPM
jgi:hypothetical protein